MPAVCKTAPFALLPPVPSASQAPFPSCALEWMICAHELIFAYCFSGHSYSALGLLSLWTRVAQRDDC
jgi:hypothetical protein